MGMIKNIKVKILQRRYELSKHAVDQSILRNINMKEIEQAIQNQSEVIEDYPEGKYGPSCLILGYTDKKRPIHILCSYPDRDLIKIITLYEPNPNLWQGYKVRKLTENGV